MGNNPLTLEADKDGAYVDQGVTLVDAAYRDDQPMPSYATSADTVDLSAPGTYTVTYEATDGKGNNATTTRTVVVRDTTDPVVTLQGTAGDTVEAATTYDDPGVTTSDNAAGDVTVTRTPEAIDTRVPSGTQLSLRYTARDASGNSASVTRVVIVFDTEAPEIVLSGAASLTVESAQPYVDPGVGATDALDGVVAVTTDPASIDTRQPDGTTIIVTYSATDAAGNTDSATRTLNFKDTTAPVIQLRGSLLVEVEATENYTDEGATATDALDGPVTVTASPASIDTSVADNTEYTITYTAEDAVGNVGTATRTVVIRDRSPPAFVNAAGVEDVAFGGSRKYTLPTAVRAVDALDGNVPVRMLGSVDLSLPGLQAVQLAAADSAGNEATTSYTVNVQAPLRLGEDERVAMGLPVAYDAFDENREDLTSYLKGVYEELFGGDYVPWIVAPYRVTGSNRRRRSSSEAAYTDVEFGVFNASAGAWLADSELMQANFVSSLPALANILGSDANITADLFSFKDGLPDPTRPAAAAAPAPATARPTAPVLWPAPLSPPAS